MLQPVMVRWNKKNEAQRVLGHKRKMKLHELMKLNFEENALNLKRFVNMKSSFDLDHYRFVTPLERFKEKKLFTVVAMKTAKKTQID